MISRFSRCGVRVLTAGSGAVAALAVSVMLPMPTEWWLRPVSNACRVGEHSAVV